jgi:predicted permease
MQALFESGRIIDLILVVFAIEAIVAVVWLRRIGRVTAGLFASLAAGVCLLLGIRAALMGLSWPWVALWIGLSLPFHLADLVSRWRMPTPQPGPGGTGRTSHSSAAPHTAVARRE